MFVYFFLVLCLILILLLWEKSSRKHMNIEGCHVLITGGSSGIGKSVAQEALKLGATNVTIVARNEDRLEVVLQELKKCRIKPDEQRVAKASIDVSKESSQGIRAKLKSITDDFGPVSILVHCAGLSHPGRAHQMSEESMKNMMDVNYFGSVKVTQAFLEDMMSVKNGCIIFTSSVAGLVGVYGLASYCASKFAIRGYAEALAMELVPYNIKVSVNCPPDTDTPGYVEENKSKPEETQLISEGAGLFHPSEIAATLLHDGLQGKFLGSSGIDGWLSTNLCIGMAPSSLCDLLFQFCFLGVMRLVGFGYLHYFHHLIRQCHNKRQKAKKVN